MSYLVPNEEIVLAYNNPIFEETGRNAPLYISLELGVFPNNEPFVKAPGKNQAWAIDNADVMILRPRTFANFMAGVFLADTRKKPIDLILPLPYGSRMDRRMGGLGDNRLFTAKSVAKVLNSGNFSSVWMVDPHSDVMPALVDNSRIMNLGDVVRGTTRYSTGIWDKLKTYDVVVAPDAGAVKRAEKVADILGVLSVVQGIKVRNTSNGRIEKYELASFDFEGKRVLVVDDICDGGATFEILAQSIPTNITELSLLITHGLFTKGPANLLKYYDQIYTTNTTLNAVEWAQDNKLVQVIPALNHLVKITGLEVK